MQRKDHSKLLEKLKKTKSNNSDEIVNLYESIDKSDVKEEIINISIENRSTEEIYVPQESNVITLIKGSKDESTVEKKLNEKDKEINQLHDEVELNKENYKEALKEVQNQNLLLEKSKEEIHTYKSSINELKLQIEELKQSKDDKELNNKLLELENLQNDLNSSKENLLKIANEKSALMKQMSEKEVLYHTTQNALEEAQEEKRELRLALESLHLEKIELENKLKQTEGIRDLLKEKEEVISKSKQELELEQQEKFRLSKEKEGLLIEIQDIKKRLNSSNNSNLKIFYSPIDRVGTTTIAIKSALESNMKSVLIGITKEYKLGLKSYFPELLKIDNKEMFSKSFIKNDLEIFSIHLKDEVGNDDINKILLLINEFKSNDIFIDLDSSISKDLQEVILGITKSEKYLILHNNIYTIHKCMDKLLYSNKSIYTNWNLIFNKDFSVNSNYIELLDSKIGIDSVNSFPAINKDKLSKAKNQYKIINVLGQVDPKEREM